MAFIRSKRFRVKRRPTVKRTRKSTRRRPVVRTRASGPISHAIGVPKCMFAKLRYTDFRQAAISASSSDSRVFRLNSVFDPDETGAGGQPYYHDQYAAMYQNYRVYGCKVDVTLTCSSSTANLYHPIFILTSWAGGAPAWSTVTTAINAKRTIHRIIIPGQQRVAVSKYFDLASLAGVSNLEYNTDDSFQALTSANPAEVINCNCILQNNDGSASVIYSMYTRLTYFVKYFDPVEPAAS